MNRHEYRYIHKHRDTYRNKYRNGYRKRYREGYRNRCRYTVAEADTQTQIQQQLQKPHRAGTGAAFGT